MRRPPPIPRRTRGQTGRVRPVLVPTANTRPRPRGHGMRRQGGEPHALALFILMLASIVLAFLAR